MHVRFSFDVIVLKFCTYKGKHRWNHHTVPTPSSLVAGSFIGWWPVYMLPLLANAFGFHGKPQVSTSSKPATIGHGPPSDRQRQRQKCAKEKGTSKFTRQSSSAGSGRACRPALLLFLSLRSILHPG